MAMQKTIKSPVIIKQETSTEAVQETIDSALSKKENAELETLQEAIQSHMNSSCECWGATPANVEDIFRRFGRTFPPETQDVDAIAEYLSTVRMLLSKNRLQVIASRCPEMTNACSALIANKKWRQKILAILSSTDDYLRYKAVCATSEILLHFTYDRDGTPAQLYKNIIQLILSDNSRLARAAALQTLTLVLQTNDHDNLTPYTKSMMLHHVQKYWKSVVNKVTCYKDKSLVELLALWNAVFVALKEPKVIQSVDEDLVHSYLLGLSRIESLLHAEDSQPLVWLKTIRLLGSAMFARTTAHCNTLLILSHTVLIGFHSSKLLESFHKMKDGFMWPDNQILGLQDIMLLVMRSLRVYVKKCESRTKAVAMVMYTVERLDLYVKSSRMYETDVSFSKWLVRLMYDRDDALIECLTIAIDIMRKLSVTRMLLDPFQSFVELTERGSYDPDLFLDHLISDETDFLCYFMKLLKIIVRFSQRFFRCCGDKLAKTMDLLYRLRRKMRRSRFPYKIEPAAKLIDKCQKLHKSFLLPSNPLIIDY